MSNIINLNSSAVTMTSREIAELVGSRHDKVKQSIERLAARAIIECPPLGNFKNSNNVTGTEYVFTGEKGKRDSIIVVAQLCPEFTAALVDRWQELESLQSRPALPDFADPAAAARAWAEQFEQSQQLALENQAQAEALAEAAPKIEALERITADDKAMTVTQAAKVLGIKRDTLTNWLSGQGWVYRQNGSWVAYQQHIQNGRLLYKEARYTNEDTGQETYRPYCHITPKGLAKIAEMMALRPTG